MTTPQPSLSVQFGREWRIRRPTVYRYLEKRFVDDFFENDCLQLSSFAEFAKHKDEERLDGSEGKGLMVHQNREGQGQSIYAMIGQGHNAYVLCGSLSLRPSLAASFKTDSGIRINDLFGFSEAISRYIPGFQIGLEGHCTYSDGNILYRDMGHIDLDTLKRSPDDKEFDMGRMAQTVFGMAGEDLFFLKSERYAHQNEYRLLWQTSRDVSGRIDIVCPEARQFCTRFEDLQETTNWPKGT